MPDAPLKLTEKLKMADGSHLNIQVILSRSDGLVLIKSLREAPSPVIKVPERLEPAGSIAVVELNS